MNNYEFSEMDNGDPRWYDVATLAGLTFAAGIGQLIVDFNIFTVAFAILMCGLFVGITQKLKPEEQQ